MPKSFGTAGTSVYGPDNLGGGLVNDVGAYTSDLNGSTPSPRKPSIVDFTYTGALDGSTIRGFRRIQGITEDGGKSIRGSYTFVHSVDGVTWPSATPTWPMSMPERVISA